MKIGIDAKWYFSGNPSGRVWTRNVVEHLVREHGEHEYVLFLKPGDRGREFPFDAERVEKRYATGKPNMLANVLSLPRLARAAGVDALVTQYFAAPVRGVRQLTVVHDVIFEVEPRYFTYPERLYFASIRPLLRSADTVLTVSAHVQQDLKTYGYVRDHQRCHVLPNGVGERFLEVGRGEGREVGRIREKLGLPRRFVLYVGRLNQRKNIDGLLRAFRQLDDPEVRLVLGGQKDWKMFDVDRLIAELEIGDRVRQLGFVDDADLPWLYRAAECFAYVSHQEGFGIPPLEAMACGTPVVVANTSSLPEVCGDAAEYVNPADVKDIARGLTRVVGDAEYRQRLGAAGRARAEQFTWRRTADSLIHLVERTVAASDERPVSGSP